MWTDGIADQLIGMRPERAGFGEEDVDVVALDGGAEVFGDLRIFLAFGVQVRVAGNCPTGLVAADPPEVWDGAYAHGFGVAHFGLRVADVEAAVRDCERTASIFSARLSGSRRG